MNALKRIIRGMGYIKGYGHHPGTPLIIGFIVAALYGLGIIGLLFISPFLLAYILGAYDRGNLAV